MIRLNKSLLDQIIYEATACYPSECCGLLVGYSRNNRITITQIVPTKNILKSHGNDVFEINPQDRLNLERKLRKETDSIIGHFHSHPNSPHTPSKRDMALAYEPRMIWLIVSVIDGKFHDFGTYLLDKKKQQPIKLNFEVIK